MMNKNVVVNTIRTLSLDMVEKANSGHLGTPLSAASMTCELFQNHLNVNPSNPKWLNRDRFILSAGHATPLLYSVLHLFGYDISIDDLKQFRQLGSKTPGHPEQDVTPGVDASTGPLGQGFATSVGMAIAEKHLADKYNKDHFPIIDHYTYVLAGDGDLMEGVAVEAAAIAGTLGLDRLIVLYDSNDICSDGAVADSTIDDVKKKYEAMGWSYVRVNDGNQREEVGLAIERAKSMPGPTMIEVKNTIGYGSSLQGTNQIHSDAVGPEEVRKIKAFFDWKYEEAFYVPEEVKKNRTQYLQAANEKEERWNQRVAQYKEAYPREYQELFHADEMIEELSGEDFPLFQKPVATRAASGAALNYVVGKVPFLVGGSADLGASNKTTITNSAFMTKENAAGNNIHFGVREFSMACIINGLTLHGGIKGYCGTFLVFLDYMKSAVRQAALMKIAPIFIFTHDSVILGPDGPTHQPIEQLASLRATPEIDVIRPCDGNETFFAWMFAVKNNRPSVLVLGRQEVPILEGTSQENLEKGAYILSKKEGSTGIFIATGSEVTLALQAQEVLAKEGILVDVVNMPSWELFERQSEAYRSQVIDFKKKRLSIEASSTFGWERYANSSVGIDEYGESGNGPELYRQRGMSVENIVQQYKKLLAE